VDYHSPPQGYDLPRTAVLPRSISYWPFGHTASNPRDVQYVYEQGYAGAFMDPTEKEELNKTIQDKGEPVYASEIYGSNGFEGVGEGKLSMPWWIVQKFYPGVWPGAAQGRGDCVSHDTKNAFMLTLCCDAFFGKPDEVTGIVESVPPILKAAILQGAFSTELFYWFRGYNGDGWSCDAAAKVAMTKGGIVVRQNYPELGFDLTEYSAALAGKYGRTAPPENVVALGQQHLIRSAIRLTTREERRDFCASGYGISTCGGEAWTMDRDEYGFSERSRKRWSHALAIGGFDDRKETWQKYGDSLELILQTWGECTTGVESPVVLGTSISMPPGMFWVRSKDFNRQCIAFCGANGWRGRRLDFLRAAATFG
jgi:hypothetical protein